MKSFIFSQLGVPKVSSSSLNFWKSEYFLYQIFILVICLLYTRIQGNLRINRLGLVFIRMKLFHEINEFVRHKGSELVIFMEKVWFFNQAKGLFYLNSFGTLSICLYANIVKHRGNHPSQGYAANPLPPPNQVKTYPPYQKGGPWFLIKPTILSLFDS